MLIWDRFKNNEQLRRFTVFFSVCLLLFLIREMMSLVLLTFIFTFLISKLAKFFEKSIKVPPVIIVSVTYLLIVILIYFAAVNYVPKLVNQTIQMVESVYRFYQEPAQQNFIIEWLSKNINTVELKNQLTSSIGVAFGYLTSIGTMGATLFFSFVLSFFFSIEEKRVQDFSKLFLDSKIGWFCKDVAFLGSKFLTTFGVVIETQFIIALINTLITTICLYFLGIPQLLPLSIMVFILSLIPVAGVIISCVPLSLIGYSIGGIQTVIYILVMIVVVHGIESYFLNPKLMSSKTELPIFYTFVILLFSEKFFGVWGLIIGIPIFVFLLDLLDVKAIKNRKQDKPKD